MVDELSVRPTPRSSKYGYLVTPVTIVAKNQGGAGQKTKLKVFKTTFQKPVGDVTVSCHLA